MFAAQCIAFRGLMLNIHASRPYKRIETSRQSILHSFRKMLLTHSTATPFTLIFEICRLRRSGTTDSTSFDAVSFSAEVTTERVPNTAFCAVLIALSAPFAIVTLEELVYRGSNQFE